MKTLVRIAASSMLAASTLVLGAGPVSCADAGADTTGRRISLGVSVAASPDSRRFTNARGWEITVTRALISTGAVYFYDGEPLFAGGGGRRTSRGWVKSAFAHPGHYVPGAARGEMRTPWSVDLLAGGVLGAGDGITGPVRSATFSFGAPATGPAAAALGPHVIVLEATATKADQTRVVRAEILPDEVKDDRGRLQIEGCPFAEVDMRSDGVVSIAVHLPMWFDQVSFDDVPSSVAGEPVVLGAGLARNQLVRAVRGGLAYTFSYAPR